MVEQEEEVKTTDIRERVAEVREQMKTIILENFHSPDDKHSSWWIRPDEMIDRLLEAFPQLAEEVEWEYGHRYYDLGGNPEIRTVSKHVYDQHPVSGYRADGSPYWNYTRMRRRSRRAGEWEACERAS